MDDHNLSSNQAGFLMVGSNKFGGNVGEVSYHSGSVYNVVQVQLSNGGV